MNESFSLSDYSTAEQTTIANFLKAFFPWLGTDNDAGSGADVICDLVDIYYQLTPRD